MKLEEAIRKAQEPMQAKPHEQTTHEKIYGETYAIPFEIAEWAKNTVGKTYRSADPKNQNRIKIVQWVGQNYVLEINGSDYNASPVLRTKSLIDAGKMVEC